MLGCVQGGLATAGSLRGSMKMRWVLGVDPGSAATGWALVGREGSRYRLAASGVIRPKGETRSLRLGNLASRLGKLLEEHRPREAAVETPFAGRNPKSAIALAEARGVILGVLGRHGVEVTGYSPAEVKKAVVGTGRAEKAQMIYMVCRLLSLDEEPPSDAADAMSIALTHLARRRDFL